jgi:hypothetical protein
MSDDERQNLKDRIAAAKERHAERETTFLEDASELASDAKDSFTQFAREHPLAVVAGGLAAGILISALFKKSPTRKLGSMVGSKAAGLAALGAEFATAYAQQAMENAEDAGRAGAEKLEDFGDAVGDKARGLKRDAAYYAGGASDTARIAARKAGKRLSRAIRNRSH